MTQTAQSEFSLFPGQSVRLDCSLPCLTPCVGGHTRCHLAPPSLKSATWLAGKPISGCYLLPKNIVLRPLWCPKQSTNQSLQQNSFSPLCDWFGANFTQASPVSRTAQMRFLINPHITFLRRSQIVHIPWVPVPFAKGGIVVEECKKNQCKGAGRCIGRLQYWVRGNFYEYNPNGCEYTGKYMFCHLQTDLKILL